MTAQAHGVQVLRAYVDKLGVRAFRDYGFKKIASLQDGKSEMHILEAPVEVFIDAMINRSLPQRDYDISDSTVLPNAGEFKQVPKMRDLETVNRNIRLFQDWANKNQ